MDRNLRYWERRYRETPEDAGAAIMYGKALQRGAGSLEDCELLFYWIDDALRMMEFAPISEATQRDTDFTSLELSPKRPALTVIGAPPHDTLIGPCNRVRLIFEPKYNEFEFYCAEPRLDANETSFEEFRHEFLIKFSAGSAGYILSAENLKEIAKNKYEDLINSTYVFAHLFGFDTELPIRQGYGSTGISTASSWRYGAETPTTYRHTETAGNRLQNIEPMLYISYTYTSFHAATRDFLHRILAYTDFILEYGPEYYSRMRDWVENYDEEDVEDEEGVPPL